MRNKIKCGFNWNKLKWKANADNSTINNDKHCQCNLSMRINKCISIWLAHNNITSLVVLLYILPPFLFLPRSLFLLLCVEPSGFSNFLLLHY